MSSEWSIAVETSCRAGEVALGRGEELRAVRSLGPTGRHAGELLPAMDALLRESGLTPRDVREVYLSVGPGSFTGLRVGVVTVRTWAQAIEGLRIVAVPTAAAVAENLGPAGISWSNLAVLLAAREATAHVTLLRRLGGEGTEFLTEPFVAGAEELLARAPQPLLLTGEALEFLSAAWPADVATVPPELRLPRAEGVWRVGRRMARQGRYTPWNELLPLYARRPEAVRLWEKQGKE